jgi:membrane associated rhomboid family serine protease
MSRYARHGSYVSSFGPGPLTPAVKAIIWSNIGIYVLSLFLPQIVPLFGLKPAAVIQQRWVWQPITYMFLHDPQSPFHIIFNLLGIWMFGVELERLWKTQFFVKYYAITGIGAGLTVILVSLIPAFHFSYDHVTIGASGALFGLLMAYAIYYPDRPILMFLLFPIPAKYFVMILGAIALLSAPGSRVSNSAHLGGLIFGYIYLKSRGGGISAEIKYRYLKWKMNRLRRKFDVYSGGRSPWDRNVH